MIPQLRRYPYTEIIGETKRAWLMMMPDHERPVRVPKTAEIDEEEKVVWLSNHIAEFIGAVKETRL